MLWAFSWGNPAGMESYFETVYIYFPLLCLPESGSGSGGNRKGGKPFLEWFGVSANFDGFDRVCSELCCIRPSDGVVYQRRNQLCGGSGRTLYERRSRTGCTVESKSESEGKYKDDGSALWSRCCGRNYFILGIGKCLLIKKLFRN